eukprot:g2186.t1
MPGAAGSTLTFGGVDTSLTQAGGFSMVDVLQVPGEGGLQYLWWTVALGGVSLAGGASSASSGCALDLGCASGQCTAIVDSGTSGIAFNEWETAVEQVVAASGYSWVESCASPTADQCVLCKEYTVVLCGSSVQPSNFPSLTFLLDGTSVQVPGAAYLKYDAQYEDYLLSFQKGGGGTPDVIMGDTVMKEYYTYFDVENTQKAA